MGGTVNEDDTPGVLDVLSGGQATVMVLVYVVVLPLLALALVRRRDVA